MNQIASAYGFTNLYDAGDLGAGQVIAVWEAQDFKASDVAAYEACYGVSTPVSTVNVDDGPRRNGGVSEADIDIETVVSLAPEARIIDYQAPNSGVGSFDDWTTIISQDVAKVVTTSWTTCEYDLGLTAAQAENTVFEEAAAQGQTILAAAGDYGAEGCLWSSKSRDFLNVDDPTSQPFVTGVGGTQWTALGTPPSETVWNDPTSECAPTLKNGCWGAGGGGVSFLWTMPAYQANASRGVNAINAYSSGIPCSAPRHDYCREVPDVSALAGPYPYWMYVQGGWWSWGGTSLASPLWASLIALTNASSACGGTTVGFANPVLYSVAGTDPSAFHDITVGNNDLTGAYGGLFPALKHYDLASGIGTPNGDVLPEDLCGADASIGQVTVTNPGPQSTYRGATTSLQILATDTNSGRKLTYGAIGLPPGLSMNRSSGLISGTVTASGVFSVKIIVEDSADEVGSASFNWSVPPVITKVSPRDGPSGGGTKVTLVGSGFKGAMEVLFGAVEVPSVSFRVNTSGTTITVKAPGGTGTVNVQVVAQSGTSRATSVTVFSYL
jgi:subtilase family serine protease